MTLGDTRVLPLHFTGDRNIYYPFWHTTGTDTSHLLNVLNILKDSIQGVAFEALSTDLIQFYSGVPGVEGVP
jgi:hypothetical protein